jgi:oligoribonuclease
MKFVFLDYETTGLIPEAHSLLEVSARVLDEKFGETGVRYHSLIRPKIGAAAASDTYAMAMHRDSGLFEDALYCQQSPEVVESELCDLLSPLAPGLVLAGNSIHFDRGFMARHMPRLNKLFGHRMLDVSALRLGIQFLTGVDPLSYEKKRGHRSEEDLDETLAELRHYQKHIV